MSLINEIKNKIKQEGSLSVYLKEYFGITDGVIFEVVLSYIDYLLKVDSKFEESIKMYLKEENSKFLLDKLLNLKLLPQSFIDKNYLEKIGFKKSSLGNKGFLNISDRFLDNNFINGFFSSINNLENFKEKLKIKLVKQFETEHLSNDKIIKSKEFVKYNFLKNAGLLDESEDVKNEILQREKLKLERDYREYILDHYQIDIKDNILDKLGYIEYEEKVENEEEMLTFLKGFFQGDLNLTDFQDVYISLQNYQLKNLLIYFLNTILYISMYKYITELILKDLDPKKDKKIITEIKKRYFLKYNLNIIEKFKKLLTLLGSNEFYLQEIDYSNFYSCYLKDIFKYDQNEVSKGGFNLCGINGIYNSENLMKWQWDKKDITKKKTILENLKNKSPKFLLSDKKMYKKINQFIQQYDINIVNLKEYKSQQSIVNKKVNEIYTSISKLKKFIDVELALIVDFNEKFIISDNDIKVEKKDKFNINKYVPSQILLILDLLKNYSLSQDKLGDFYGQFLKPKILKDKLLKDIQFFSETGLLFLEEEDNVINSIDEYFNNNGFNLSSLIEQSENNKEYPKFFSNIKKNKEFRNGLINKFGNKYEDFIKLILLYKKFDLINTLKQELSDKKKKIKISRMDKDLLKILESKFKENELILGLGNIAMYNTTLYSYKSNYLIDTILDYFKVDKFIYSFYLNTLKLSYIDSFYVFLLKIIFYNLSKNIFSLKLLSNQGLRNILTGKIDGAKSNNLIILSENLFFLYSQIINFLYKYFFIYIEKKEGTINEIQYNNKIAIIKKEVSVYSSEIKEYINVSINYLLSYFKDGTIRSDDHIYIKFMNLIIKEFDQYFSDFGEASELLSHLLKFAGIKEQEIDGNIKNISSLLTNIDVLDKINVFKLLHLLITEDVAITKSDEFFIVGFEEYAFVILQKQEMGILNSAILTLESNYKDKEHVFIWTNSEVFSFLYQKILLKLNLVGVGVTTRDLLSWLYFNNEISDLDIYGTATTSSSRIKVRINGTYQLLKRYDGNQEKTLFSFSDLENFINDLFTLGGTIGDQSVEDTAIKIGGVKFRIGIMKDGDNISLSARKISSTSHKFSIYKGDQLLQVLRDNFGFEPTVQSLYYERDQVTLDMSYSKEDVSVLLDRATSDRGIFMIIGKTRSGKSTSLRNFLDYLFETGLSKGEVKKVVTLEDPIEFSNPNWNQIEVPAEAGVLEDAVNKGLKRQDPDIVVVGETRSASTLPGVLTVANNSATFTTMHITNPIDGLFTLKDFAKANGNTLMDVVNVLNIIVSQKLVNKINKEKVEKVFKEVGLDYDRLYSEGITLFKDKEEIQDYLEQLGVLWLVPVTREPYHILMDKYKKKELDKDNLEYVEGYLYYCKKTFELFEKNNYLIKEVHKKYTMPKLYYDYVDRGFIDANMELILRMDDKNSPIKELKQRFVDTFSLKEEKALEEYFLGELPYFDGLNILDVAYYIYILKKLYILEQENNKI